MADSVENSTKTKAKRFAKKYLLLIIAVLFIVVLLIPYLLGYRLVSGLHLERVGTLVVTDVPAGTSVFVDQSLHGITQNSNGMHDELVAGSHSIIVSANGDYPWSTLALITSAKTTTINPILLHVRPDAIPLTGADRTTALAAIASNTLPTLAAPLYLANGCTAVYVENNQVIAAATSSKAGNASSVSANCTPAPYLCSANGTCSPTIIFSPIAPLKFVGRYPDRQDAIVVQFGATLFALALDPRSPQFFAPVLTGTLPHISALADGTIVVNDGKAVYKVQF